MTPRSGAMSTSASLQQPLLQGIHPPTSQEPQERPPMSAWEASTRFFARATSEAGGHEDLHDLRGDATECVEAQLHQAGCQIQMENEGPSINHQGPPQDAPVSAVLLLVALNASTPSTAILGVQLAKAAIRDLGNAIGHSGWQSREALAACQALQWHEKWLSAEILRLAPTGLQKTMWECDLSEVRDALQVLLVNRLCDPNRLQHIDEKALEWLEEMKSWAGETRAVSRDKLAPLMSHAAQLALEQAIQSPTKSGFRAWFNEAALLVKEVSSLHYSNHHTLFKIAVPCLLDMPTPSAAETWLHEALQELDPFLYLGVAKQALIYASDPWQRASGRPLLELPAWDDLIPVDAVPFPHQDEQRVEAVGFQFIRNCAASLAADQEIASNDRAQAVMVKAMTAQAQPNPACEIPCCNLI